MSRRGRTALGAALFAVAVSVVGARIWGRLDQPTPPFSTEAALVDFRDAVYYPVVAFLAGENPYDRSRVFARYPVNETIGLYSPLTLLLHLPFGMLPYRAAEAAFVVLSFGLAVVLAAVAWRIQGGIVASGVQGRIAAPGIQGRIPASGIHSWTPAPGCVLGLAGLLVLSRPGHWNLMLGQVAFEIGLATIAALWLARTHPRSAGLGLAVVTCKATYGLPLVLVMAARRDFRALAIGLGAAVVLTGVPLLVIVGRSGLGGFASTVLANYQARVATPRFDASVSAFRVDVVALVARGLGHAPDLLPTLALTGGVLAVAMVTLRRLGDRADGESRRLALAIASLAIVLCTYHQQYDLVLLAPLLASAWPLRPFRRAQMPAALVALPFGNYVASGGMQRAFGASDAMVLWPSSLNIVALLAAFGLLVRRAWMADSER